MRDEPIFLSVKSPRRPPAGALRGRREILPPTVVLERENTSKMV